MSKPKVFEKPTGVKDYLPDTVARLRKIEFQVLDCMERWGYRQILTPTLEFYDTVGKASSTSERKLFKLLDQNGRTLVLRSEMTAPIARVAASLLKDESYPLRLSYHSNVFRAFAEEGGKESEFFQTGGELIGDGSPSADAEVIALAVAALTAAGVGEFKIALGHVGFLNGLFEDTLRGRTDEQQSLKECLLNRDYVGYRQQLKNFGLSPTTLTALEGVLRLSGGEDVCEAASKLTADPQAQQALGHLRDILDVLKAYGVMEHVLIDLTLIGDFSYYTGMTFEGYSSELGFPVCSGGRYDNLLKQFGRPAPATGFALKTDRILEMNGTAANAAHSRTLILYTPEHRKIALQNAANLRGEPNAEPVETLCVTDAADVNPGQGNDTVFHGRPYRQIIRFCD